MLCLYIRIGVCLCFFVSWMTIRCFVLVWVVKCECMGLCDMSGQLYVVVVFQLGCMVVVHGMFAILYGQYVWFCVYAWVNRVLCLSDICVEWWGLWWFNVFLLCVCVCVWLCLCRICMSVRTWLFCYHAWFMFL